MVGKGRCQDNSAFPVKRQFVQVLLRCVALRFVALRGVVDCSLSAGPFFQGSDCSLSAGPFSFFRVGVSNLLEGVTPY